MTEAEKQAQAIFEEICATADSRPWYGQDFRILTSQIEDWKANHAALAKLRESDVDVHLALLARSFSWLRAEAQGNLRVADTIADAIRISLRHAPKPLPTALVVQIVGEVRGDYGMARSYFPLLRLLETLTREQVTDELRVELKKLLAQYAPTARGKVDEHFLPIRKWLLELTHVEGERVLDPGRGPWSQIVYDEIKQKDQITRAGWEALLEHCASLEQTIPGAKWKKKTDELMRALGDESLAAMLRWLALGPTPGEEAESRSPIEDSAPQKGMVWAVSLRPDHRVARVIADFGIACLRKIPMIGAVSQKVGFACVQSLGAMKCEEAISQLTRLRMKVKYTVARRLIEKSLQQAAERAGVSTEELEDFAVPKFGLDESGRMEVTIGDATAMLQLALDGSTGIVWKNAAGKLVKSAPAEVRKAFPKDVKGVATLAKEIEQAYAAQRARLEASFLSTRTMTVAHWRQYFVEHPLLGLLGRKLIWVFRDPAGGERSGLWVEGEVRDASRKRIDISAATHVRLWHPLSSSDEEVQQWREQVFTLGIRQPVRQAFREFYRVNDEERGTRVYSNRFAGVLMRQHQLASLCRTRGWDYRLMGAGFDGGNVPSKQLAQWNMHVEFYVDLPPDRDSKLLDSAMNDQSSAGINLFVGSDQVCFYRDRKEVAVDEVPAIVFSEIMREVDLFTSVCEVGDDESWRDQGERGGGVFNMRFDEMTSAVALRAELLERVLPHTKIADRCKVIKEKGCLEVRGQLGTYRIALGWGWASLVTEANVRHLVIPRALLDKVDLDVSALPIDLDYRSESALRKAHILANDWNIDSPELIEQLSPR